MAAYFSPRRPGAPAPHAERLLHAGAPPASKGRPFASLGLLSALLVKVCFQSPINTTGGKLHSYRSPPWSSLVGPTLESGQGRGRPAPDNEFSACAKKTKSQKSLYEMTRSSVPVLFAHVLASQRTQHSVHAEQHVKRSRQRSARAFALLPRPFPQEQSRLPLMSTSEPSMRVSGLLQLPNYKTNFSRSCF